MDQWDENSDLISVPKHNFFDLNCIYISEFLAKLMKSAAAATASGSSATQRVSPQQATSAEASAAATAAAANAATADAAVTESRTIYKVHFPETRLLVPDIQGDPLAITSRTRVGLTLIFVCSTICPILLGFLLG